ncbi:PepSY domain-containing protein, partial [Variovorax sp. 2RAF20]
RYRGERLPWKGTAADIFVQAPFPLHSGRILGIPGRILISLTGLVVAALSVTGVVIWLKKRRARVLRKKPAAA